MTITVLRNNGVTTTVIYGGNAGPTGRPGASGTETLGRVASGTVTGLRAVSATGANSVAETDPNDRESMTAFLGIAKGSALNNEAVDVQTLGVLTDVAFSWTVDEPIWIGASGQLTQVVPLGGFLRKVGVALSPTSMAISLGPLIRR